MVSSFLNSKLFYLCSLLRVVRSQISDCCLEVRGMGAGGGSAGVPTLLGTMLYVQCCWISCWLTLLLNSGSGSLPGVCSSSVCCCSGASVLLGISLALPCSGLYKEGGLAVGTLPLLCQAEITDRSVEVSSAWHGQLD